MKNKGPNWFKRIGMSITNKSEKNKAPSGGVFNKERIKNFMVKASGLIAKQGEGRDSFEYPEYDLEEIKIASESDSYIKQALMKYSYLIYKAGYKIRSENESASDYIKTRFRVMGFTSGKPFDILMQEVSDDVIKYSNAFLVKTRDDTAFPGVQAKGVYADNPVAGYFRIDPSTVQIRRNENGKILGYQQTVNGKEKKYRVEDVVHFYIDKDPGNNFGTPRISAALEDVKLLRKIEGNVISLIYRFAIPIYQWIVGVPEAGFQATDKEIDDVEKEIQNMDLDGYIVTNERTAVKAIGAEGHALDANPYLKYFEQRVFTALGVSDAQMGRGGAKKDGDSMEAQVHDTVRYLQRTMSIFIENYIINELLLEGGFNPIINEEDIVRYDFEETSLETKIKVENHDMLKFQSSITELEETRKDLGYKEKMDEKRNYSSIVTTKSAIEQIKAKGDEDRKSRGHAMESIKASGLEGNGKIPEDKKGEGQTEVNNRPENQHGKGSVSIKESYNISSPVRRNKGQNKKVFRSVYNRWSAARNGIVRGEDSSIVLSLLHDTLIDEIKRYVNSSVIQGKDMAIKDMKVKDRRAVSINSLRVPLHSIDDHIEDKVKKLVTDISKRIKDEDTEIVFNSLEYRIRFILEYIIPKSHWVAYAHACKSQGVEELYVDFSSKEDKEKYGDTVNLRSVDWEKLPAFHPFCKCKLSLKKVGE